MQCYDERIESRDERVEEVVEINYTNTLPTTNIVPAAATNETIESANENAMEVDLDSMDDPIITMTLFFEKKLNQLDEENG